MSETRKIFPDKAGNLAGSVLPQVFFVAFLLVPFVDSLNGVLSYAGFGETVSFGMVYRSALIAVCVAIIALTHQQATSIVFALAFLAVFVIIHLSTLMGDSSFLANSMRILLPFLCVWAYKCIVKDDNRFSRKVVDIFKFWSVAFPLCILPAFFLGVGKSTYETTGFKAFFISQNDLSFVLIALFAFMTFELFKSFKLSDFVIWSLVLASIVLLGLKSAYLFAVLTILYAFIRFPSSARNSKLWLAAGIGIAICGGLFLFWGELQSLIQNRWLYFAQRLDAVSFITSGRAGRIESIFAFINENGLDSQLLFGMEMAYSEVIAPYAMAEMDLFDLLFQYGLFAPLLVVAYLVYSICHYDRQSEYSELFIYILVLGFFVAFFAGHVFNSALAGMCLAAVIFGVIGSCQDERMTSDISFKLVQP